MRQTVTILLVLGLAGLAHADSRTGNRMDFHKSDAHVGLNPGTPDGREGGETLATAVPIFGLPYFDNGNTCDNINDYDYACPYTGSTSPDVVYVFNPAANMQINVDLCLSGYDTKVYIYAGAVGTPIACNDDFYSAPPCYTYSSFVGPVSLTAGTNYYIVVDGYGGDCGDYAIEVTGYLPPDEVPCPPDGVLENEPPLFNGYVDNWDGGCNSTPPAWSIPQFHWHTILTNCGWLCGNSGWYLSSSGEQYRDTDWYPVLAAGTSMTFTVWAARTCDIYVLNACYPLCVPAPAVLYSANTGGNWGSGTVTWPTLPGQAFVLWVGPDVISPPSGGLPQEFNYVMEVCGHAGSVIPEVGKTWGAVKSLFR